MSLRIIPRPSQGGEELELKTIFLEDISVVGLQAQIDALTTLPFRQTAVPTGELFIADIQFRTSQMPGGNNFAVMIVTGQWNPI